MVKNMKLKSIPKEENLIFNQQIYKKLKQKIVLLQEFMIPDI